jgi:tetratricopeptide (TPR) repeat protein
VRDDDLPATYLRLEGKARKASRDGKEEAVIAVYQEAIERFPEIERSWRRLATALFVSGERDGGVQILESGLREHPDSAPLLFDLMTYQLLQHRIDAATEAWERLIETHPDSVWTQVAIAKAARTNDDHETARDQLRQAYLECDLEDFEMVIAVSTAMMIDPDLWSDTIDFLTAALERHRLASAYRIRLGIVLEHLGRQREARRQLRWARLTWDGSREGFDQYVMQARTLIDHGAALVSSAEGDAE